MELNKISFLLSFPPIQSAFKISGDGNGMRIIIDVPETQMPNAIQLMAWREKVIKGTFELEEPKKEEIRPL